MRKNIATGLVLLGGLWSVLAGVIGLLSSEFPPYHEAIAGIMWAEVDPRLQTIILADQITQGSGFLASGLAVLFLLIPLRRGELWAHMASFFIAGANWVPTLFVAVSLRTIEPAAETPVVPSMILLGLIFGGTVLFLLDRKKLHDTARAGNV
ncbi:MAG: hypothetical protein JKY60_15205 [Kordiimonadaceae bacterium]|nr:hypothetical protein [Kordiimonadaceae bacterium]